MRGRESTQAFQKSVHDWLPTQICVRSRSVTLGSSVEGSTELQIEPWRNPLWSPQAMRVSLVHMCTGREHAAVDADPSWRLCDLLAAIPEPEGTMGCRLRLFLGAVELHGSTTLGDVGAEDGSQLTLLATEHRVATCCGATARIWSAASGQCLRTLEGHHDLVTSAVFSPDGQQVLTSSNDLTARIWSATSGQCLHTLVSEDLDDFQGLFNSAVFSPDGQEVLTSQNDETTRIWSAASGQCLRALVGAENACFAP